MTQITARGWPGLANYKPPEGEAARRKASGLSLRTFDLWLLLDINPSPMVNYGVIRAYSGSVQLAEFELIHLAGIQEWCDPLGTVETHPYGFWRAYAPNCAIVGYDLGYQIGQLAEFWQTTRSGAYRIFPYGWGKRSEKGQTIGAVSPHRPPLLMRPRLQGWHVQFANPKSGPPGRYGKWQNGKPFAGNFIDLQSVEYALG